MPQRTASEKLAPAMGRDALIDRALDLADRDGLDSVTIRRLAQDFAVTPMALYWHVKNKDELLEAMGDRLYTAMQLPAEQPTQSWDDELQGLLNALLAALRAHPGSITLAAVRIMACPAGLDLAERSLKALARAGFSVPERSAHARSALQTAIMLVSGEPGAELEIPFAERESVHAQKMAVIESLPVELYPNVVECAADLIECEDVDLYYRSGIGVFIAGVRSVADNRS